MRGQQGKELAAVSPELPDFKHHRSYSLFAHKPAAGAKILFFIALSIVLMTLDHHYHNLEVVRSGLSAAVYPLRVVASLPYRIGHTLSTDLASRRRLLARNAVLERQALEMGARLQQLTTLEHDNAHLRALMDAAATTRGKVRVSEIMSVDLDPFRQQIVIDKGDTDGAYLGQPLLGAHGIMGQITHVGPFSSVAILITDPNTAIPVEISRNGLRTIAVGTGSSDRLDLPYLPNNADVRQGDVLVTSGLAGRFPHGYPVAVVTSVVQKPGEPFADIDARPAAELGRSHEVLLLWPAGRQPAKTVAAGAKTDTKTKAAAPAAGARP